MMLSIVVMIVGSFVVRVIRPSQAEELAHGLLLGVGRLDPRRLGLLRVAARRQDLGRQGADALRLLVDRPSGRRRGGAPLAVLLALDDEGAGDLAEAIAVVAKGRVAPIRQLGRLLFAGLFLAGFLAGLRF